MSRFVSPMRPSRRHVLGATPAFAALTAPALAASATTRTDADGPLLVLRDRLAALRGEIEDLDAKWLSAMACVAEPPAPDALRWRADDYFRSPSREKIGAVMSTDAIARLEAIRGVYQLGMTEARRRQLAARIEEVIAARDRWEAAAEAARRAAGVTALTARLDVLVEEEDALERRAFVMRATTPAGLAFKASLVRRYNLDDADSHASMSLRSLLDDMERAAASA
ncbi:hypothetical protein [Phenylobacterium sp.]|uniref:hypothetical protein n=1 Tax=Phenylobacterium sp. TaxID=1871053 RepID=UPI0035AECE4B